MILVKQQFKQIVRRRHALTGDKNKKVCCWGVPTWAEAIAIFGIIDAVFTLALVFVSIAVVEIKEGRPRMMVFGGASGYIHLDAYAIELFNSYKGMLGMGMALILLFGVQKKKPVLLSLWLIAHGIQLTILSLLACFASIHIIAAMGAPSLFFVCIGWLYLAFMLFCFWLVAEYRQELLYHQRKLQEQHVMIYALCPNKV